MKKYNYLEAVVCDVKEYIETVVDINDFSDRDELFEYLYDDLFDSDLVTGNASGSYYCDAYKAEEALCHNWSLLFKALNEFDCNVSFLKQGAEACDVIIRCYLLPEAINTAIDELDVNY